MSKGPRSFGLVSVMLAFVGSFFGACYPETPLGGGGKHSVGAKINTKMGQVGDAGPGATNSDDAGLTTQKDAAPSLPSVTCTGPVNAEGIPGRDEVTSTDVVAKDEPVFTRNLFNQFSGLCGGCHVQQDQGKYIVNPSTFATAVDQKAVDRMLSDNEDEFMPPPGDSGGKPASERKKNPNDAVLAFAAILQSWIDAGRPTDLFYLPAKATGNQSVSPYLMSKDLAGAFTNIGTCIPIKQVVGFDAAKSKELDAKFDAATALPERLEDTDLVTFDSEVLARRRVIGYAPGYPLWADDAKKLRYIKVPDGESIHFNSDTQKFEIPKNTRFYKTFLKKVIDDTGHETFRKMETRLIVSRPDGADGPTALFGTYKWNPEETEATLHAVVRHDGTGFVDDLQSYVTDEVSAADILAHLRKGSNADYALRTGGVTRTYAIPGSQRCIDCHMGSASQSFILGLTPLQIRRRPVGEGGVIEPTGDDELNQLKRLIDYGVITGLDDEKNVVKLEESQLPRTSRNDYELKAQGYMLGNCGHCHNPHGLPSVKNPELVDLLDFWPSAHGGIFQFDMEKASPRIKRGAGQDVLIHYVTPSLRELPTPATQYVARAWSPKKYVIPVHLTGAKDYEEPIPAPWRSLIYRNVDTPFTYTDDGAFFPHMPLNTPGYDCRARQILGDWMVSIPSKLKPWDSTPALDESLDDPDITYLGRVADTRVQPYVEVKPPIAGQADPGSDYETALRDAQARLDEWHQGPRYGDCPDTSDIVDPTVDPSNPTAPKFAPSPEETVGGYTWPDGDVPSRPHWVVTDLSDTHDDWYPRRGDWEDIIVKHDVAGVDDKQKVVLDLLNSLKITQELKKFALTELPYGLWVQKPSCDLSSEDKASKYTGSPEEPAWFKKFPNLTPSTPIYTQTPAAAVFNNICANCHGPNADSKGRLADTLLNLTGGDTRVANLRDGFFGPTTDPGAARQRVFGPTANRADAGNSGLSVDDWASRYLVWMGLGGTRRLIPSSILTTVSNTLVLGETRNLSTIDLSVTSANMLQTAQRLCTVVLGKGRFGLSFDIAAGSPVYDSANFPTALITRNEDAYMWEQLCRLDNPLPVRVVEPQNQWTSATLELVIRPTNAWFPRATFPADAPLVTARGQISMGVQADDPAPWCLRKPVGQTELDAADQFRQTHLLNGQLVPYCPPLVEDVATNGSTEDDLDRWTTRGAMNAGLAVYLYLDAIEKGTLAPKVAFDQCELRK